MKKSLILFVLFLMGAGGVGAATFTVSSSADSGPNTLRQCLLDANSSTPPNEILFSIGSPYIISPLSALPTITNQVDINAAIGYPDPTVSLAGSSAGAGVSGLRIQNTAECVVQGLRIYNFEANGVYLYSADNNTVQRCAFYSNDYGVVISAGLRNLIGGNTAASKNTISANAADGVEIVGNSVSNQISGNYIGTDETGTVAWPNGVSGVNLFSGSHTLVGGPNAVAGTLFPGNLISGNGSDGVYIYPYGDGQNQIQGNLIGTDRFGQSALPNGQRGIICLGFSNVIGGVFSSMRNTVSGNNREGISLDNALCFSNEVIGNFVGTDNGGTLAVPNGGDGIEVTDAPNNRIGGTVNEGNLLSGNTGAGLQIQGFTGFYGATGNVVQGNFIGTDVTGRLPVPNQGLAGLVIECADTLVGGTNSGAGNVIGGNTGYGVRVEEEGWNTRLLGNWIGPYDASLSAISNGSGGVIFYEVGDGQIGGTNQFDRNTISGNGGNGIYLYGSNCVQMTIAGNFIGLDSSGAEAVGNSESGIRILYGQSNQIGLAASGGQNLISGNTQYGIEIQGNANEIYNNFIGPDATGEAAVGNGWSGVYVYNSQDCRIGGYSTMEGNLISGNEQEGVLVDGTASTSNELLGNWIGCDLTQTNALGNGSYGVRFGGGAYSNLVGGGASDGNAIAFNGLDGLYVGSGCHGIAIVGNSLYFNGQLGIDLHPGGPTANDPLDADSGANGLQNFPILTSVTNNGLAVLVTGYLESEPSKDYRVEFFFNRSCDPSGYGEGEYVMALVSNMMTDVAGFYGFTNLAIVLHDPPPDFLTATATDLALWNTSEFSPFILLDSDGDGMGDGYEDEYFGGYQSGNPAGDLDGDGATNGDEFDADTDPSNSNSIIRIAGMSNFPAETLVGLESSGSRQYQMQRREKMDDALIWNNFDSIQDGTGGVLIFTDSTSHTTQFYRALARIPEVP